ncbi:MAG: hypothetical protein ACRELB_21270, partial [Polyangiaceae bacterium]
MSICWGARVAVGAAVDVGVAAVLIVGVYGKGTAPRGGRGMRATLPAGSIDADAVGMVAAPVLAEGAGST